MTLSTVPRRTAAALLGIAPGTLKNWALAKPPRGPIPIKIGRSRQARAFYRTDELAKWQADPISYEQEKHHAHRAHRQGRRR